MSRHSADLAQHTLRLVEDTELSQHCRPVVIDLFSSQTIFGVERVHPAKRDLDSSSGRRKPAPLSEMRAANYDLDQNGVVCDMPALHVDFQVRQRLHKLLVK